VATNKYPEDYVTERRVLLEYDASTTIAEKRTLLLRIIPPCHPSSPPPHAADSGQWMEENHRIIGEEAWLL
jgi:hypothetical protein